MDNLIEWLQSLIIGMVQGFTEPLPISSSGHVVLVRSLFNQSVTDLSYELFLNIASFLAVLVVLRKELFELFKAFIKAIQEKESNDSLETMVNVLIGSIPIIVIGLLFRNIVESWLNVSILLTVGLGLWFTALVLFITDRFIRQSNKSKVSKIDAFWIGLFQVIAIIPGISRSGMTFSSGILRKISPKEALTYSMYLYLVVSFGGILLTLSDILGMMSYFSITAFIGSFVMTLLSLKWFYKILEKRSLIIFSIYCFTVGLITLGFAIS